MGYPVGWKGRVLKTDTELNRLLKLSHALVSRAHFFKINIFHDARSDSCEIPAVCNLILWQDSLAEGCYV